MEVSHPLHGRVKRFWIFMLLTSGVAFAANALVQMLMKGEVDIQGALTLSLTLGIVLAMVMASQKKAG